MSRSVEAIVEDVLALPADERERVRQALLLSLDVDGDLDDETRKAIIRRVSPD